MAPWTRLGCDERGRHGQVGAPPSHRLRPPVPPPPAARRPEAWRHARWPGDPVTSGPRRACAGRGGAASGSFRAAGWGPQTAPRAVPFGRPPALRKGQAGPKALRPRLRGKDERATSSLPSILSGARAAAHTAVARVRPVHGSPASSRRRWSHIPRSGSPGWPGRTCLRGSPYRLFLLIMVLYVENEVQTSRPVHPEANVASEKQPVCLGVRPHGLAYASWHSVAGLIREWPSCLPEFLVSRGR